MKKLVLILSLLIVGCSTDSEVCPKVIEKYHDNSTITKFYLKLDNGFKLEVKYETYINSYVGKEVCNQSGL